MTFLEKHDCDKTCMDSKRKRHKHMIGTIKKTARNTQKNTKTESLITKTESLITKTESKCPTTQKVFLHITIALDTT